MGDEKLFLMVITLVAAFCFWQHGLGSRGSPAIPTFCWTKAALDMPLPAVFARSRGFSGLIALPQFVILALICHGEATTTFCS